jgi:Ti-type conjugative transfer relaxase TraA
MMSIAAMGVGAAAADYCIGSTREDYYTSGGDPLGLWRGCGSAALGLSGSVDAAAFRAVLQGLHPDSNKTLTGSGSGATAHRSGWDCTFSAPKSVSVLWALSDMQTRLSIEQAHENAITAALSYLETHAAFTRRGHGGSEQESVKGVVSATFKHFTSRAGDPQLHTHCIVMNVAPREDGSFGTIDSKHLYDHKMAAGAVYRMVLGTALVQQGFELSNSQHGFEVAGVNQDLCRQFSKRREQISQALAEHGGKSAAASQIATLATRGAKQDTHLGERLAHWRTEAMAFDPALPTPIQTPGLQSPIDTAAVLKGLTQGQSTFAQKDLMRAVAVEGAGRIEYAELLTTVKSMIESGAVVRLGKSSVQNPRFTTTEVLAMETRCLETAAAMAEQRTSTIPIEHVERIGRQSQQADGVTLSEEQSQAVRHIASLTGRVALVEGLAGTGKTQMLKTVRHVYEAAGFKVYGCSLSGKAAQNLEDGSGIQSQTLHRLLARLEKKQLILGAKDVVILDEAAMVGSRQMEALLGHIARAGAKLVMVGDSKQLQPIDAGQMFGTLVRELGKSDLTEIRRQNQSWARDAVRAVLAGQSAEALTAFDQRGLISRSADATASVKVLTEHWLADTLPMHKKLVLAGTRLEAYRLNQSIRQALQTSGNIGTTELEFSTAQGGIRKMATGDRVVFLRNDLGLGVKNGTLGIVTACPATGQQPIITVQIDGGKKVNVPLEQYNHVDHGYALTVHKAQGTTIDGNVYVMASDAMTDREWSYVALSRAKGMTRIYTSGIDDTQLQRDMQRSHRKDTSLDHAHSQDQEL